MFHFSTDSFETNRVNMRVSDREDQTHKMLRFRVGDIIVNCKIAHLDHEPDVRINGHSVDGVKTPVDV